MYLYIYINKRGFQSKCLRQITKAPFYVSNHTLQHKDHSILTVQNVVIAKTYKRLHSNLHRNPLISELYARLSSQVTPEED